MFNGGKGGKYGNGDDGFEVRRGLFRINVTGDTIDFQINSEDTFGCLILGTKG